MWSRGSFLKCGGGSKQSHTVCVECFRSYWYALTCRSEETSIIFNAVFSVQRGGFAKYFLWFVCISCSPNTVSKMRINLNLSEQVWMLCTSIGGLHLCISGFPLHSPLWENMCMTSLIHKESHLSDWKTHFIGQLTQYHSGTPPQAKIVDYLGNHQYRVE